VALAWLIESGAYSSDSDEHEAALDSACALDAGRPSQIAAIELTKLMRRAADIDGNLRLVEHAATGLDPKLRLDASVRRIELLSAEGRHDEAGRAAAAVLEPFQSLLSPDHYLFLGQVFENAGTVDLAVSAFRQAEIGANTDARTTAMLEHARVEHRAGRTDEAVALLERALFEGHGDARDRTALALASLLREGREDTRALAVLDEVLPAANRLRPELLFERASILFSLDREDEAREPLRELVELSDPRLRAHSLEMLARIEERAEPDAAIEIFRTLVEVEHDHSAAYAGFRLGEWHLARGEPDRALEVLRRSAALRSTDSSNAMQLLVTELERQGCDAKAREELDRYLDSNPDAPPMMFVRIARMYAASGGKPLTTLRRYNQALQRAVEDGESQWVAEAGSHVFAAANDQGDYALAENALRQMRTHGDPLARGYAEYQLAERMIKDGRIDDAVVHLENTVSLDVDPYAGHAWRRLADYYLGKGDIERANVARSKIASRGSLSDALRAELVDAASALLADDRPRAREIAERVCSLAPDEDIRARATFVLSELLVRDGRPEEAKTALQELVAADAEDVRHQALLDLAAIDLEAGPGYVLSLLNALEDAHCAHGARASVLVGVALTALDRDDEARAAFARALASRWCDDTARRQARFLLAVYAEQEGSNVEDDCRAVIDWSTPDDITTFASSMLIECLAERGDSDGIRSAVVPWMTLDSEQAPMFVRYATALADLIDGSARDAALQLGALSEDDDENVRDTASLWLGRAHAQLGNTELARKALATASRSGQQSVAAKSRQAIASLDK
jgi:tetratricopeptide (TPR) repeat protein